MKNQTELVIVVKAPRAKKEPKNIARAVPNCSILLLSVIFFYRGVANAQPGARYGHGPSPGFQIGSYFVASLNPGQVVVVAAKPPATLMLATLKTLS
jgi:hypothetical protein